MSEYVTIEVHNEFAKRVDEENTRQNHRLAELESTVKEIQRLSIAVEKMAVSLQAMTKELEEQGDRLEKIEKEPADKWKTFMWELFKYILVAALAILAARIGAS